MADDTLDILIRTKADTAGAQQAAGALNEVTDATKKGGAANEEAGKAAEKSHMSHRALHLLLRQVGEASKGAEIGLTLLSGVMMGSAMFAVRALAEGVRLLTEHFAKEKEKAMEAANVTVQFWTDTLQGSADARTAADEYITALSSIGTKVDELKKKEGEETEVLKLAAAQRLNIIEAERLAEIAMAKGNKEEEARINARYARIKTGAELENEQAGIGLMKGHLGEQSAATIMSKAVADATERAKEAGMQPNRLVNESKEVMKDLEKQLKEQKTKQLSDFDRTEMTDYLNDYNANASKRVMYSPTWIKARAAQMALYDDKNARESEAGLTQEIVNRSKIIEEHETRTRHLTEAADKAKKEYEENKKLEQATKAEIGNAEAAHRVNVDASAATSVVQAWPVIKAAGAPNTPQTQNIMADILALGGADKNHHLSAGEMHNINALMDGISVVQHAKGQTDAQVAALIRHLVALSKDQHVDIAQKFAEVWEALRANRVRTRDMHNQ